jgi:cell wall assembly regulator SMI1
MDAEEVFALLQRAAGAQHGGQPAPGADAGQLGRLADLLGYPVPADLREWLTRCNGSDSGGPGALFGAYPANRALRIEAAAAIHPQWIPRRWVPVASDGTGNYYLLDASHRVTSTDAVFFVDTMDDPDRLAYVVGSRLLTFLRFLLTRELDLPGASGWPFDPEYVLARDPDLALVADAGLLPWNA